MKRLLIPIFLIFASLIAALAANLGKVETGASHGRDLQQADRVPVERTPRPMTIWDKAVVDPGSGRMPFMFDFDLNRSEFEEKFFDRERFGAKPVFVLTEGGKGRLVLTVHAYRAVEVCFEKFRNLPDALAIVPKDNCVALEGEGDKKDMEFEVRALKRIEPTVVKLILRGEDWKVGRAFVVEVVEPKH